MLLGITSYKIHESQHLSDITLNCLKSTTQHTSEPVEVVIVDDSSALNQTTMDYIHDHHIVKQSVNWTNLSKSLNHLLRYAFYEKEHENAIILNNDIILEQNSLQAMLDYFKSFPKRWFVVGKETCGHEYYPFSAFGIKKALFETIGPFDEKLWYGHADVDYMLRMENIKNSTYSIGRCDGFRFHHEPSSTRKVWRNNEPQSLDDYDKFAVDYMYEKWGVRFAQRKDVKGLNVK